MSSLLSNLVNNLSDGVHKIKWTESCLDYISTKDNELIFSLSRM